MSTFREKARGRTKQMVGQMIGDEKLVEEGREQEREAEQQAKSADAESAGAKSADDKSSDTKSADDRSGRASRHRAGYHNRRRIRQGDRSADHHAARAAPETRYAYIAPDADITRAISDPARSATR